ncbi:PAS domain-containing protein [Desulfobacula sp.]|uniref:PAS domain-containing protein n=1 Tax=Desulfobacula sp. TaxID=2593537 RepID=UPI00345B83F3
MIVQTSEETKFYKDSYGCYTGCNKAFENFIGKSRSEIIGKTVYDMGSTGQH